MLLAWLSNFTFTSASNDAFLHGHSNDHSKDLQASAQYYRPYNYNQRPNYPSNINNNNRWPSYSANSKPSFGTTKRPNYPHPASAPTASRPGTINLQDRFEAAYSAAEAENHCNSTEGETSSQGPPGICWDPTKQKIRIAHNLTIENFVIFYTRMESSSRSLDGNARFRDQICEQSKRFDSGAIICVPNKRIPPNLSDVSECPENARKTHVRVCSKTSKLSNYSPAAENCICVLDQYFDIAAEQQTRYFRLFVKPTLQETQTVVASHIENNNWQQYVPAVYQPLVTSLQLSKRPNFG